GLHCQSANGAAVCSDGNTCDPSLPTHCNGNRLIECDSTSQLEESFDYGYFRAGATCKSDGMGNGGCTPAASPNCTSDSVSCQGTTAVICASGGEAQVPCG